MNIFNISTSTSQTWITWPGHGLIRSPAAREKLLHMAFDASPDQIGICFENGSIHWLSSLLYYQRTGSIDDLLYRLQLDPLSGIGFSDSVAAEKFINTAEKYIVMTLLTRDYDDV